MNSTARGRAAESSAAAYLQAQGFELVARNFRTRQCEIDIVACKDGCMYFIEVKYRAQAAQGTGLEYITAAKQRQMRFAAETWLLAHGWQGEVALGAIEVSGSSFQPGGLIAVW